MTTKIEAAYQTYVQACFNRPLPRDQDTELRLAFFGGIGWFQGTLLEISDDEKKTMEFFSNIEKELREFVESVKMTIQ